MVRPRWRKVARDLRLHRGRTLAAVLAIAVGLAGAGAVLDTWALLRVVTRESYRATNPASATLRVDAVTPAALAAARAVPAVARAEARRTLSAAVQTADGWRSAVLFASDSLASARIGVVAAERGAWPPPDGGIVIERSSVEFAGVSSGDTVRVRVGDGEPVRLPVVGVARDAGLAPGWMEHVVYAFVTPTTLGALGAPSSLDQLQLVVRDRALGREEVRRVAFDVRAAVERAGVRVRQIDVPEPGRHVHAAQMESLLLTKGAFGVLALLLSGLLVVNLVTAALAGQLREIGVMKAVGARPGQLAAMYLGLALALGILATAVAVPAAAVAARAYASFAATLLNFSVDGYAIPRWAFAVQVAAGLALPVAAAAVPVIRGSRLPAAAALRDTALAADGAAPAWLERVRGPRRPLLLSLRNTFRRRGRTALTLFTLAAGGAVFLAALDLRAAIRASVGNLYGELMRFDLALRLDAPHAADSLIAVATAVPGVRHAESWAGARAAIDGELAGTFALTALDANTRLVAFPPDSGRWLRDDDAGALVVNERLAEEMPSLGVGRTVTLIVDGRASAWTVVGRVRSGPTPAAYVTRAALAHVTGDGRATSLVIDAARDDEAAHADLILRVRAALDSAAMPVAQGQLMAESRRVLEDHLLMVAGFLLAMAQLTLVVGGLGLASTMSLAVLERTREIGVLRAIGASPRAIRRLVRTEGLVIALASWAAAVPLSLPASLLLGRAFGRIMFPVPLRPLPEPAAVAVWLAVVVVVSVGACAWPARRATRIPAREALAYE